MFVIVTAVLAIICAAYAFWHVSAVYRSPVGPSPTDLMLIILSGVLALVFAIVALAAPAAAQSNCALRDVVTVKLEDDYNEGFVGGGLQNSQSIFEVWSSGEGGTWTVLMTRADGMSCVMASGTNWRKALPQKVKGAPG